MDVLMTMSRQSRRSARRAWSYEEWGIAVVSSMMTSAAPSIFGWRMDFDANAESGRDMVASS